MFQCHTALNDSDGVMAEQDSVGNQLLRQRPDLVRRAWVPILVRIDVDINVINVISDGNSCHDILDFYPG